MRVPTHFASCGLPIAKKLLEGLGVRATLAQQLVGHMKASTRAVAQELLGISH